MPGQAPAVGMITCLSHVSYFTSNNIFLEATSSEAALSEQLRSVLFVVKAHDSCQILLTVDVMILVYVAETTYDDGICWNSLGGYKMTSQTYSVPALR